MTKVSFTDLITRYNSQRMKINIILFLQAPIIFILLWKISNISVMPSPLMIMSCLMALWFYWVHLMINLILADAKIICDNMGDDFAEERQDLSAELPGWDYYKNKLKQVSLPILAITLVLGIFAYMMYSKNLSLLIVVVGTAINHFIRIDMANNFMCRAIKAYTNKFTVTIENFKQISPKIVLLPSVVFSLIYIMLLIYLLKMPVIYYVISLVAFSALTSLTLFTIALKKYFLKNIGLLDSLRSL